ncbi:MAG: FliM/FliN family flagellar motor switch protein [Myxococcota bacterium]
MSEKLGASLRVEDVTVGEAGVSMAGFRVTASLGQGRGKCEARLCPNLTAALHESLTLSPSAPLSTHPDPVTAAVLGHGVLLICSAIAEAGLARPTLLSDASIGQTSLCLAMDLVAEGKHCSLQILLDDEAARALTSSMEAQQAKPRPQQAAKSNAELGDDLARLPVLVRLSMGPVRLSAATLETIRPGDAVCPDPRASIEDGLPHGPVFLSASAAGGRRIAALGRIEGRSISITGLGLPGPTAEEPNMSQPLSSTGPLSVDVQVVIETLPMTLAELSRVGAGSVIPLSTACPRPRLMVGEQTLAVGELVDVDGVLGVRVLERGAR